MVGPTYVCCPMTEQYGAKVTHTEPLLSVCCFFIIVSTQTNKNLPSESSFLQTPKEHAFFFLGPKPEQAENTAQEQERKKMHSFGYRANALLTFAVTILALMCAMASLSDNLNHPSPTSQVQVLNINWFQKQPNGNDEVSMTMNISADLQSLFTWNTKQVFVFLAAEYGTSKNSLNQISLWDGIIPSKEHAKFSFQTSNKYRFIDQGNNLRGKEFNLTLHWHVMPKTGKMFADKIVMSGYRLPQEYR